MHTVIPTAGGTILPKVYKAYRELIELGLVEDNAPKIYSAQAAGCNPVVTAIHKGSDIIEPQKPNTIAKSIAIGNPADGSYAYKVVQESGGWGESASDREIVDAIKLLAKTEGIWTEPAGGTTLAAAIKLIESGRISKNESIVISITGNGLKCLETVQGDLVRGRVVLHLLTHGEVVVAHRRLGRVADPMPAAKRGERRIRDRDVLGHQLFVHADQVAPALVEQFDDLIAVRLRFLGALKSWHRRRARVEHAPDRCPRDLQRARNLADPVAFRL